MTGCALMRSHAIHAPHHAKHAAWHFTLLGEQTQTHFSTHLYPRQLCVLDLVPIQQHLLFFL